MRVLIPVVVLALLSVPALAQDGGALGQLENATSGNQTLSQTYGDTDRDPGCPDSCPSGTSSGDAPDPGTPQPVDSDDSGG
jgi:hypothetical protein